MYQTLCLVLSMYCHSLQSAMRKDKMSYFPFVAHRNLVTRPNYSATHCRAEVMGERIHSPQCVFSDSSAHALRRLPQRGSQAELERITEPRRDPIGCAARGQTAAWQRSCAWDQNSPGQRYALSHTVSVGTAKGKDTMASQGWWSFLSARETPEALGQSVGFVEGERSRGASEAL